MNKENVLFSIVGVLVGFIVGFVFANTANRPGLAPQGVGAAQVAQQPEGLPPGHPAVDPSQMRTQVDPAALNAAVKLADEQPDNFAAQTSAAGLSVQAGRYDDAVRFYTRANKAKPDDYETLVNLGNTLFDAEKLPEAEKWYAAALAKTPNDVNVRTDLGLTFLLREPAQIDRAVAEFNRSLAVEPTHPQTLQNLTVALTRKGDIAGAEAALAKLQAAAPQSPAIQQLRAGIDKAKSGAPAETSKAKAGK
ncbi:MAG TPA: tetratricopeptide repeat protein [Pyrinomonadaceae bacterium]|nr:tetratricopeptide repeat protein [Pyrinomonadaceae bacterium]